VYTGSADVPVCTHIDDVVFLKALEIGDLVYLHSQVVFTLENRVQTRVSAEVLDRDTKRLKLTNVLQVTFQLPSEVPHVVPKSYHEAMAYLTGRRHFLVSLEREGVLDKTGVEHALKKNTRYTPMWTTEKYVSEVDYCKKNILNDSMDEEDMFMGAEMTNEIRDRENKTL